LLLNKFGGERTLAQTD